MAQAQPYEKVVDYLIDQIEQNEVLPWDKPWLNHDNQMPQNIRGTFYRGMNLLNLAFVQMIKGYSKNVWLTYNQAKELGGNVNAGEKGVPVIFWKILVKKNGQPSEEEDDDETKIPFIRVYTVFNADQCTLPPKALEKYKVEEKAFVPIEEAERIVEGMKKRPNIFKDQIAAAYYKKADDSVHIPKGEYFKKEEYYYSTMFHELVHSTGHQSRLNREGVAQIETGNKNTYSEEELVAEIGATILCSISKIEKEPAKDHVAYLQNWVRFLKDHKKALIYAAQRAQKAVDFILA